MSLLKVSTSAGGTNDTAVMGKEAEDVSLDLLPVGLRDEEAMGNGSEAFCKRESEGWCKCVENDCQERSFPFL